MVTCTVKMADERELEVGMDPEREFKASSVAADSKEEELVQISDEEGEDDDEFIPGFATVEDFCKV